MIEQERIFIRFFSEVKLCRKVQGIRTSDEDITLGAKLEQFFKIENSEMDGNESY